MWTALTASALAQLPQQCLPDANADAQPLFATPSARIDLEHRNGTVYLGKATSGTFADIDRNGTIDVIVAVGPNSNSPSAPSFVSVLRGSGDGVFGAPEIYDAGARPADVQAVDVNHDGWPDLEVVNRDSNDLAILMNRGDGTFLPPVFYPVGEGPSALKVLDVNHDGLPDIIVLNPVSDDVSVLFNRGNGTFMPQVRYAIGGVSQHMDFDRAVPGPFFDVGDLDGDGSPDIAVPARHSIRILLNNGAGGFTPAPISPAVLSSDAYTVVLADLDRDGKLDIAAEVNSDLPSVSILRNRGGALFDPPVGYQANPAPGPGYALQISHMAVGDVDGDGYPDLVLGYWESWQHAPLFRNRGDGTFAPQELVHVPHDDWWVALKDVNGDGRPDLLTFDITNRSELRALINDGRNFLTSHISPTLQLNEFSDPRFSIAAADFDHSGRLGLAFATSQTPGFQAKIARNASGGNFIEDGPLIALGPFPHSCAQWIVPADLDGDGWADMVISDAPVPSSGWPPAGTLWTVRNLGNLNFAPAVPYSVGNANPDQAIVADFNRDGHPDVAVWTCGLYPGDDQTPVDRRVLVFLNDGHGSLSLNASYLIDSMPWFGVGGVAAADLDGDGFPDLVATSSPRSGAAAISVMSNQHDGTFSITARYPVPDASMWIVSGDFNHDGRPDIVVGRSGAIPGNDHVFFLFTNDGHGGLLPPVIYSDARMNGGQFPIVADFDGDGNPDLAFNNGATRSISVFRGRGDGTFDPMVGYAAFGGVYVNRMVAGDFENNGRIEIAVSPEAASYTSLLQNVGCRPCYANCDGSLAAPVLNVNDFVCFQRRFAQGDPWANCDHSTTPPILTVQDFSCFLTRFAAGCP